MPSQKQLKPQQQSKGKPQGKGRKPRGKGKKKMETAAATRVQAAMRGRRARLKTQKIRKAKAAATKLQTAFRGQRKFSGFLGSSGEFWGYVFILGLGEGRGGAVRSFVSN